MEDSWVLTGLVVIGGAVYAVNALLDHIPRTARKAVRAVRALRAVKAALKDRGN